MKWRWSLGMRSIISWQPTAIPICHCNENHTNRLVFRPPSSLSLTLLEIMVLRGVFTNTYNKPYPIGFPRCEKTLKVFQRTLKGCSQREGFFENPTRGFSPTHITNPTLCWWKNPEEPLFLSCSAFVRVSLKLKLPWRSYQELTSSREFKVKSSVTI
jgi:hypothetical protein